MYSTKRQRRRDGEEGKLRKRDAGNERRNVRMGNRGWKNAEKEREKGIESVSGRRGASIKLEPDYKKT